MHLTLCRGAWPDNRGRAGLWQSVGQQTAYFDNLEKITLDCRTVPVGEDILVTGDIPDLSTYNYGWILYDNDPMRYYISIYDFKFTSMNTTKILYKLDVYETYLYFGLRFGRAAMERMPLDIGRSRMIYSYDNYVSSRTLGFGAGLIALGGWQNEDDSLMASLCNLYQEDYSQEVTVPYYYWLTGAAYKFLWNWEQNEGAGAWNDKPADLRHGTWYPDYIPFQAGTSQDTWQQKYRTDPPNDYAHVNMIVNRKLHNDAFPHNTSYIWLNRDYDTQPVLTNTRQGWDEIRDMRGNVIFRPNFGQTVRLTGREYKVTMSGSAMILNLTDPAGGAQIKVPMPGESVDSMIDSWLEYQYRQRAADMEARHLQNEQQLAGSAMNAGTGAISGAVTGAMQGSAVPGVGTAAGAVAGALVGAAVGLLTAQQNYAVNEQWFAGREQGIIDEQMHKAVDSVNFYGSAAGADLFGTVAGVYHCTPNTMSLINHDIDVNGYPVDHKVQAFQLDTAGKYKGDVEVLGLPGAMCDQVKDRLAQGVWFL